MVSARIMTRINLSNSTFDPCWKIIIQIGIFCHFFYILKLSFYFEIFAKIKIDICPLGVHFLGVFISFQHQQKARSFSMLRKLRESNFPS